MHAESQPPVEGMAHYVGDINGRLEEDRWQRRLRTSIAALMLAGISMAGVEATNNPPPSEITASVPGCDEQLAKLQLGLTNAQPRHEPLKYRLQGRLEQVPTLAELGTQFSEFADYEQRLAHINKLDQETNVSVCDYQAFVVDKSRSTSFTDQPNYHKRIQPGLFVFHITATRYPDGVDGFIKHLKSQGLRVAYFIDEANTYSLFEDDTRMPAHAKGLNSFSQGVEIEAVTVYGVTSSHIKKATMKFTEYCLDNNLTPSEYTGIGHYAGDVIFDNPSFNPHSGKVDFVDKSDMPQELVQVIVKKAQALHAQLVG